MSHEHSHSVALPSETVAPTRVDTASQQASTSPGDGKEVLAHDAVNRNDPNLNVVEVPGEKPTWKDQVIGYAKETRGTLLGKTDTKQEGQAILRGEVKPTETQKTV